MNITMEDILEIMDRETVYETTKKDIDERLDAILELLKNNNYKYIARDQDGNVSAYLFEPKKCGTVWYSTEIMDDYELRLTTFEKEGFKFPCKYDDSMATKIENIIPTFYFYAIHKPNRLLVRKAIAGEVLHTLNGDVTANNGDYVITGVNGEQYPCDPEIFKKLYDIVE